jgi:hypothetical protein
MKTALLTLSLLCLSSQRSRAQDKLNVTGTPIPSALLAQNYGTIPKGIAGYDLNICNIADQRQTVVSSQIFQSLSQSNLSITPIGRGIMLAAILRGQNRSPMTIAGLIVNSATTVLALLSTAKSSGIPDPARTGITVGSLLAGQLLTQLKPILAPDKLEKFDRDVLESALVLDAGSCVEKTVFALAQASPAKPSAFQFKTK